MICMIWLMLPGGSRTICILEHVFPGLDLYYTDPAQTLTTAVKEPDDLDDDLSDLSVRGVLSFSFVTDRVAQPM